MEPQPVGTPTLKNTATGERAHALRIASYALWLLSIVATALLLIPFSPEMPTPGLDPSWRLALNVAIAKGLVFGRDLIFTFGPLGSVYTTVYSPETNALTMSASVVYAIGFASIFGLAAYPRRLLIGVALPLLVTVSISRDSYFIAMPLLLLLGIVRICSLENSALHLRATPTVKVVLVLATIALGMTPIIKGSFIGVVIPIAGLSFVVLARKNFRAAVAFVVLLVVSLSGWWIACGQPIDALPKFFIAQSPIISGYTEAMSYNASTIDPIRYVVASAFICVISWGALRKEERIPAYALIAGTAWTFFVAFKSGFVRHDGHVCIAAGTMLFIAFAVTCFAPKTWSLAASVISIVVAVSVVRAVLPVDWPFLVQRVETISASTANGIRLRLKNDSELQQAYVDSLAAIRKSGPLPNVSGTVDVYPVDLAAIFANGLAWSGRPVFQSYSAYTPALLKLNADHLLGAAAPQNVFFTFGPIDHRLPTLDDSTSIIALLSHYRVAGYEDSYVHFVKSASANGTRLADQLAHSEEIQWGQDVAIREKGPLWISIDMRRSLLGRAAEALFKLPLMEIDLTLADGTVVRHRYVPEIGRAGFIISPYMTTGMNLVDLAAGIPDAQSVKSFRLVTRSPMFWRQEIKVTMTPIEISPQKDARATILAMPQASQPAGLEGQPLRETQCAIDLINGASYQGSTVRATSASTLSVMGWIATPDGKLASDFRAWFVSTSDSGKKRYFPAKRLPRPDVAKAFNRSDLVDSGYMATLDTSTLEGPQTLELVTASKTEAFRCPSVLMLQ
ncbi:hypothetical protein [Paraburkholderia sp. J76]|uniref:hypothetical protein n=1 Tax=Paraburkholderia sp. J76 TaxID=2805439 RepID=UPI002ABD4AFB|nr:hypothetical protein [Paraburkholderia sp. J76]